MISQKGVTVVYDDIAVGAKDHFKAEASEEAIFSRLAQLEYAHLSTGNLENPVDGYGVLLDGRAGLFSENVENESVGYWSEQISNKDGFFAEPIILTFISNKVFETEGITLQFDEISNVYSTDLYIQWYLGDEVVSEQRFNPNNSVYSCVNKVYKCDKVVISFYRINSPLDRLRIKSIKYGREYYFTGENLKNVTVSHVINPICTDIPISTTSIVIQTDGNNAFNFKEKQPIYTYFNGKLQSSAFVKRGRRTGEKAYIISAEDYISALEGIPFKGGIYEDEYAVGIIKDIFSIAKIPYSIAEAFNAEKITGHIPYTNCRSALMQVCFAIGAMVSTAYSDKVNILELPASLSQKIPRDRISEGQSFEEETKVTEIQLTQHTYLPSNETRVLYDAEGQGEGDDIFIKFTSPVYDLQIERGRIREQGANYARINAYSECLLIGKEYIHEKVIRSKTSNTNALELSNVISIKDATLISSKNIDKVLNMCYNELRNVNSANMGIYEKKHIVDAIPAIYNKFAYNSLPYNGSAPTVTYDKPIKVGDIISFGTQYLGELKGRVIQQTFNLNGNIILKQTKVKQIQGSE